MNIVAFFYLVLISLLGIPLVWLLPLPFSPKFKILIGPAIGIIASTEATFGLSVLIGFSPLSIGLGMMLMILSIGYAWRKNGYRPQLKLFHASDLVKHWPLLFILVTVGVYAAYIFWTKVLYPMPFGLVTGGEGLYGDTALHSAYTSSMVAQKLPPQNPLFAGTPLIYPFLVNFFSAILVTLGMSMRFAFILPHFVYFIAFCALFYKTARLVTSRLGSYLTMNIFFLGWGWGFIQFLKDSLSAHTLTIAREYTNNFDIFNMHNVLTGLIFPERSFLPGLVLGLFITHAAWSFVKTGKRAPAIVAAVGLGLLPLWHTHTFIFFAITICCWFAVPLISSLRSSGKRFTQLFKISVISAIITLIIAGPMLYWLTRHVASQSSFAHFTLGWMGTKADFFRFWLFNTGLLIPLAVAGLFFVRKTERLLFVPAFLLFILANLVSFQPWDWDNIKLFSWVFLFLSILAGHTLVQFAKQSRLLVPIVLVIFMSLTASGFLSLAGFLPQTYTIYDNADSELVAWTLIHTKNSDIFLIDPWPNHPIPGLSGRSAYMGYPGHLWVHGIDYGQRETDTNEILRGDTQRLRQLAPPINYIVTDATKAGSLSQDKTLELVFTNHKFAVFKVL